LLTDLLRAVSRGEDAAWRELVAIVHPRVVEQCRRRRLSRDEDIAAEVAAHTLDRLRAQDFAALRRFLEIQRKYPATKFDAWLAVIVRNVCIDTLRSLPELQRRRVAGERHLFSVPLLPFEDEANAAAECDLLAHRDVQRLVEFLLSDDFPNEQRRAIALWLEGMTNDEIASELGLAGPSASIRLLNAARQRMRRRFPRSIALGAP
jgi:RNA polymerase sigma factor (sigma-70 family)